MEPLDYNGFLKTLEQEHPSEKWPASLRSLWFDAQGNWEASHNIAQDIHDNTGSWIHAYLHRKEGDDWNAGYWYGKADRPFPKISLGEEFKQLVLFVLETDFPKQ